MPFWLMLHFYPPDHWPYEPPSNFYLTIPRIKNVISGHHWDTSFPQKSLSRIPEGHVSHIVWPLEKWTLKGFLSRKNKGTLFSVCANVIQTLRLNLNMMANLNIATSSDSVVETCWKRQFHHQMQEWTCHNQVRRQTGSRDQTPLSISDKDLDGLLVTGIPLPLRRPWSGII